MGFFNWINSQSWFRPTTGVLTAIAYLVQNLTPSYTVAHRIADVVLGATLTAGTASLGRSSTGLPPAIPANATHFPPGSMVVK